MGIVERVDNVPLVSNNTDGTWAYRVKHGIGVAPAGEFEADPVCDQMGISI